MRKTNLKQKRAEAEFWQRAYKSVGVKGQITADQSGKFLRNIIPTCF